MRGNREAIMESKVEPAIIAGVVALIGFIVTLVGTIITVRRQTRTQIDTVRRQTRTQIDTKIHELTQEQFKDILAKRIEVYPKLWYIAQTMLSDLEREGNLSSPNWAPDANWARHTENGVFLSQPSYNAFAALRDAAVTLVSKCNLENYKPTLEDFQRLDRIYYRNNLGTPNEDPQHLPLATWLKNDLGSYKSLFISYPVAP
jgi:hypothetical protein